MFHKVLNAPLGTVTVVYLGPFITFLMEIFWENKWWLLGFNYFHKEDSSEMFEDKQLKTKIKKR